MADGTKLERALAAAADDIAAEGKRFALVGGLAVSVRAEVRFTRDVDLAVAVDNDMEAESLVYALKSRGYTTVASVEHEAQSRLATIRLRSPKTMFNRGNNLPTIVVQAARVSPRPGRARALAGFRSLEHRA